MRKILVNKWFRWITGSCVVLLIITGSCVMASNLFVAGQSKFTYHRIEDIPYNRVGLVLGTIPKLSGNHDNLFFVYRMNAAAELFHAGKIDYILASGDNSTQSYDEPSAMKTYLIGLGVPEERIFLDYAGFRTFDSMIRANEVFGLTGFTVISQQFHNERAIAIARWHGLDVVGYNAADVRGGLGKSVAIREYLARPKLCIDLLVGNSPKFLGEPVVIQ
jgi:SanA protein